MTIQLKYQTLLENRLFAKTAEFDMLIKQLFETPFENTIEHLHFEIFLDGGSDFEFRLFGYTKDQDPWITFEKIENFNISISKLWPFISQDEYEELLIWEDDPKYGKQIAINQPVDDVDVAGISLAWLRSIIEPKAKMVDLRITIGVHDLIVPQQIT